MKDWLEALAQSAQSYIELRYHKRLSRTFAVQNGRVDTAHQAQEEGVGVRAYINGAWGFASTAMTTKAAVSQAIARAQQHAMLIAKSRKQKQHHPLAAATLSRLDHVGPGFHNLAQMPMADKLAEVITLEQRLKNASGKIHTAACRYKEILEEKIIVTSDGACAAAKIALPEISLTAIAEDQGEQMGYMTSAGVNGDWQCLYAHPTMNGAIDHTAQLAIDLLKAKNADGGLKTVILAPALVGLLCHEAIGHTVEADFVKAGSIAQGKIGQVVASPLVNLNDSGHETIAGYAVGNIPFDDEGVPSATTRIIENGTLVSYLHNRETAAEFGVAPTGNSRAWRYSDEPLIRMRNTYMLPGQQNLAQMIAEMEDGYLVEGAGSGQADSNGEFMFGCSHLWRIQNGKKTALHREATLSGMAFNVLKTVDAVSQEFRWDLGSGYCGKGQPAKVDAGGPYIRCQIHVGGVS